MWFGSTISPDFSVDPGSESAVYELRRHSRLTTGISAFPLGWPWEDDFKLGKRKHVLQALLLYVFIIVKGAVCGAVNIMIAFAYK